MQTRFVVAAMVGFLIACGSAVAGTTFAPYEGNGAIVDGQGGTKVVKDEVEFWTTGTPPHHYQILGVLTDSRGSGLFGGDVLGSGTAKRIKDLGGSAAIVLGHDSQVRGGMVNSYGQMMIARRNTTQLLIVKYLDGVVPAKP